MNAGIRISLPQLLGTVPCNIIPRVPYALQRYNRAYLLFSVIATKLNYDLQKPAIDSRKEEQAMYIVEPPVVFNDREVHYVDENVGIRKKPEILAGAVKKAIKKPSADLSIYPLVKGIPELSHKDVSPLLDQSAEIHFIHVPKCGGTSLTASLRRFMCDKFKRSKGLIGAEDCCINPGFCEKSIGQSCKSIAGCQMHFPHLKTFARSKLPIVTMLRHPVSRAVSGWFYHCHNPNSDCFDVREEFDGPNQNKRRRKKPYKTFSFDEYLDMQEYSNVYIQMFALDSHPYKSPIDHVEEHMVSQAANVLNEARFVGIQEAYDASMILLAHEFNVDPSLIELRKMRKNGLDCSKEKNSKKERCIIKFDIESTGSTRRKKIIDANKEDIALYYFAVRKFCARIIQTGLQSNSVVKGDLERSGTILTPSFPRTCPCLLIAKALGISARENTCSKLGFIRSLLTKSVNSSIVFQSFGHLGNN
eukprot:UC4_evm8s179